MAEKAIMRYREGAQRVERRREMLEEYFEYPSAEDQILAALDDSDHQEVAELIDMADASLSKALREWDSCIVGNRSNELEKRVREALSALRDIYMNDSDDPRANGWVDDRGRP